MSKGLYALKYDFKFDAAHCLSQMPAGHKCANLHGHCWRVRLELRAHRLNDVGFVVDFHDVRAFAKTVEDLFDHQLLNGVLENQGPDGTQLEPTCENIAKFIYEMSATAGNNARVWCESVTVQESEGCSVTYSEAR